MGQVYDNALLPNLAKFEPAGKNDPRLKQYEEIVNRGEHALAALQQNLDRAPAAARHGLLRAWEAQNQRLQRGHGKAKHPVFNNPNGFVPPGQNNQRQD